MYQHDIKTTNRMRFNLGLKRRPPLKNYENATAYRMTDKYELYTAAATSLLNDSYYESGADRLQRLHVLVAKVAATDPAFVAQLAVYAREQLYLRSVPLLLTALLARVHNGDDLVRRLAARVIQRADELPELLAAYASVAGRQREKKQLNRLPAQLRKGVADAFNKFDAYQFAKYAQKRTVSLRDALFLTHPKAKDEAQQALFDRIASRTLEKPMTWEVQMSELGQKKFNSAEEKAAAMRQSWTEFVQSGRLGYMALLRNLRNFLRYGVDEEALALVAQRLADPAAVRTARQMPFRYLSAYLELQKVEAEYPQAALLMEALERAVIVSAEALKGFDKDIRVLIATDMSGSMTLTLSDRSGIQLMDVGLMLAMLLKAKTGHALTGFFGEVYRLQEVRTDKVLANVEQLRGIDVGHSTNGYLVIRDLLRRRKAMDKVLIFTDMQLWNSNDNSADSFAAAWSAYKRFAPKAKLYLFDLSGYGQAPLRLERDDVTLIAGWSEKVFDMLDAMERGGEALEQIGQVEL